MLLFLFRSKDLDTKSVALPEIEVVFLKKIRSNSFVSVDGDVGSVSVEDVVLRLPKPVSGSTKHTHFIFTFDDVSAFNV